MDYEGLNRTLARYFEDPALVQGAKTRAIVVIYKARAGTHDIINYHSTKQMCYAVPCLNIFAKIVLPSRCEGIPYSKSL